MAEGETKQKRGSARNWWLNAALAAALVIAAIFTFYVLRDWHRSRLSFRLDEDVSLQLVGVLHDGNEEMEPRAWLRKLYQKIPEEIRYKTEAWWKPESVLIKEDLTESELALVFRSRVRSSSARDRAAWHDLIRQSVLTTDIGLRLQFTNGGYTGIQSISQLGNRYGSSRAGSQSDLFFGCSFDRVPLTAKEIMVEVVQGDSGNIQLVKQVPIPNPAYRKMQPIGAPDSLPATVTHDGVSVTLEALVSNTISGLMKPTSEADSKSLVDPGTMQFRKHDGRGLSPPATAVALRVNDADSTDSAWQVHELQFFYGDNIHYRQPNPWKPLNLSLERGHLQVLTFPNDVGTIGQPVKLIARLVRHKDFHPDELVTFIAELPTTGTYTTLYAPHHTDGPEPGPPRSAKNTMRLQIANQAVIPYTSMHHQQTGLLTVHLTRNVKLAHILSATLIAFDGTELDLAPYMLNGAEPDRPGRTYDLHNQRQNPNTPAIDSALIDKIRVTVVKPKLFGREFEFIAAPTEAQLPP